MSMTKIEKSVLELQELIYPYSSVKIILKDRILDFIKENPGCEMEYLLKHYECRYFYIGNNGGLSLDEIISSLLKDEKIYLKNHYIYEKNYKENNFSLEHDSFLFVEEWQNEQEKKFFEYEENSKEMIKTMRQF